MTDPERLYERPATACLAGPHVSKGKMLASEALRIDGKSFAYLSEAELVLKLPEPIAAGLVTEARATPLQVGKRMMRDWVVIPAADTDRWESLMSDAMDLVGDRGKP